MEQNNSFIKKIISGLVGVGMVLVIIYFTYNLFGTKNLIQVTGSGTVTIKPEKFSVVISRVDSDSNISTAIDKGSQITNELIRKSMALLGDDVEVRKSFYTVERSTDGYMVMNGFGVVSKNIGKASDFVKLMYQSGATTVGEVSFVAGDEEDIQEMARKKAVEDAMKKAAELVSSVGKKVVEVVSISDETTSNNVSRISKLSNSENIDKVDSIEIGKTVTVVYQIK